ncbi:MAG: hypothetical protein IPP71_11630 [Bacteroidetes bacterium]|nr:hypothetical protein [Bacteroidota bacterium]
MCSNTSLAQHYYLPLNQDLNVRFDSSLYKVGVDFHTSVKPYISNEVAMVAPIDSFAAFQMKDTKFMKSLVGRKIFNQHLVQVRDDDYFLYGDIIMEFSAGRSMEDNLDKNTFINSRGIAVGGTFGKHFSFNSTFLESQSTFSSYIDSSIRETFVVPGASRIKNYENKYDYGTANGTIAFSLKKHFSFQFGHDKNFIGDGYRSMLLSDNSYNYPFLKINASFWKIRYMVLYALFQDGPYITFNDDESFRRKYGTFHYLDVNIGKRLTVGVLEGIIWDYDSTRAFDINYLNPVIFLRPVEFSIGSPDNALIGFNARYKLNSRNYLYGQLMLDEFKLNEVKADSGWWGNKQAFQLGFRSFSPFGIKNLIVGSEFNYARPFTYQHKSAATAYSHYNQPLAHPLGANFWESVSSVSYSLKRWNVNLKVNYAKVGYDIDSLGNEANFGNNVLLSYETRPGDYGNETLQGLETTVINSDFKIWYLLNPAANLVLEAGTRIRKTENRIGNSQTVFVYFGIRTALWNRYLDF